MFIELIKIIEFIWNSIVHVWPYLLITVPIAVAVRMSGASKYIGKAFGKSPIVSILLATIVGAFSPFCSCSVIPIIAALLIGGVPLAPVMSFWLASPSMDPEIFFLSVTVLGWKLALWRLSSAFAMSFFSGFITHYLTKKGWITEESTLKAYAYSPTKSTWRYMKEWLSKMKKKLRIQDDTLIYASNGINIIQNGYGPLDNPSSVGRVNKILAENYGCCDIKTYIKIDDVKRGMVNCGCSGSSNLSKEYLDQELERDSCCNKVLINKDEKKSGCECSNNTKPVKEKSSGCGCGTENNIKTERNFTAKLIGETTSATFMVVKFMVLAYLLEALIILYVPEQFITTLLGKNDFASIIMAALIGIPVYTSTMPALALVGGLISKGMIPAAGLAFLISGPTTTVPAMAAVWNLANRKVFFLYVGFTLAFSIISGLLCYALYSVI